jgi:hypothetical protein
MCHWNFVGYSYIFHVFCPIKWVTEISLQTEVQPLQFRIFMCLFSKYQVQLCNLSLYFIFWFAYFVHGTLLPNLFYNNNTSHLGATYLARLVYLLKNVDWIRKLYLCSISIYVDGGSCDELVASSRQFQCLIFSIRKFLHLDTKTQE